MKTCICNIVLAICLLCVSMNAFAQEQKYSVTLNTGTKITGFLRSTDKSWLTVINDSGHEITVAMTDVYEIKELGVEKKIASQIVETAYYPERITLEIAGKPMEFILVRGGTFMMGYDGRESQSYGSGPEHKVTVTSFYLSKNLLSKAQVGIFLMGETAKTLDKESDIWTLAPGSIGDYGSVNKAIDNVVAAIDKPLHLPLRLPTEAEWEYVFTDSKVFKNFAQAGIFPELCYDYWDNFSAAEQLDPIVTETSQDADYHVSRFFSFATGVHARKSWNSVGAVRLAIKADEFVKITGI